jgi:hypothetical protein
MYMLRSARTSKRQSLCAAEPLAPTAATFGTVPRALLREGASRTIPLQNRRTE